MFSWIEIVSGALYPVLENTTLGVSAGSHDPVLVHGYHPVVGIAMHTDHGVVPDAILRVPVQFLPCRMLVACVLPLQGAQVRHKECFSQSRATGPGCVAERHFVFMIPQHQLSSLMTVQYVTKYSTKNISTMFLMRFLLLGSISVIYRDLPRILPRTRVCSMRWPCVPGGSVWPCCNCHTV